MSRASNTRRKQTRKKKPKPAPLIDRMERLAVRAPWDPKAATELDALLGREVRSALHRREVRSAERELVKLGFRRETDLKKRLPQVAKVLDDLGDWD